MDQLLEKECTVKCRSASHAKQILNCAVIASSPQIRSYSAWLCHNFSVNTDELGRNLLHIASSCGKWDVVEWLLEYCNVEVDVKDFESGWTALHRSFFYGQLVSARILRMYGASLRAVDREGFTPLDVILKDRLPYIEYLPSNPSDVYVWGLNVNYNLGLGKIQSRDVPEILEVFRKDFIYIKQVNICKFHSAFLTTNGKVYTCGYGYGGRLGQGSQDICLVPSLVKGLGPSQCLQISAGQDHLLLLIEGNQVLSCGTNTYHQLGHIPPPEQILVPKPLSLKGFLKGKPVIGIKAARFHSVLYTKDCVYTFGLNAGQLGHPKGDRTQIHPRQVSGLYNEEWHITNVEASDGATVCASSRGDIYVLHEYQIRKIASKQLEILKLSVVGGHLDSRCDVAGVKEGGGMELKVVLLTKSGKLYLWRQNDPYFRRCLFTSQKLQKELIVSDIHINHYSLGLITTENEGFLGTLLAPFKEQRPAPPSTTLHTPTIFSARPSAGLTQLLDSNDCNFIRVKKLPLIYRGTSITSDSKGRNFAVLQSNPKMGLVEVPMLSESGFLNDFERFFSESYVGDNFHDMVIEVGKRKFAAHKYILASRSDYFKKRLLSDVKNDTLIVENMRPEAFEQVLKFIYTNKSDFLTPDYEVKWENLEKENGKKKKSGSKSSNPIIILQEASKKLGINTLAQRLEGVELVNGKISASETSPSSKLHFNRHYLPELADVNIHALNGSIFNCHKCILIARLDYFHSMLSTSWAESSQLENLSLPISSDVMEVLLDFIYADKAHKILDSEDAEFVCQVLMLTDQLMIKRLKELCEMALVELITLKNAAELLELASVYNALQLKQSCMQFISLNLAAVIEAKSLEVLSDEVMQDLSSYYRSLVPSMYKRRISSSMGPSENELECIVANFPVSSTCTFQRNKVDAHNNRSKSRRRLNSFLKETKNRSRDKTISESSDKDIILDVIMPDIKESKIEAKVAEPVQKTFNIQNSPPTCIDRKPGQWTMHCFQKDQYQELDKIMLEEKSKLTIIRRKLSSDMKPIPHVSQKQKKKMEHSKDSSFDILIPSSPPNKTNCPWAKLPEQSPPSPSFWDAFSKGELQHSTCSKESLTPTKLSPCTWNKQCFSQLSSPKEMNTQGIVISLSDIQKDEEQKQRRAVNPKIKPLDLINIEDQAIEELLVLYGANDNAKEKIIVSRVLEEIANPVWKKKGK